MDSRSESTEAPSADSDEYVFDGFKVMFDEKVMLTAVAPIAPSVTPARTERLH